MLKVLHLVHNLNRGGIQVWLLSMLQQMPRHLCQMDVCCKGWQLGDLVADVEQLGAKVWHCPLGVGHLGFAQQLRHILTNGQYDILHIHTESYSGFPVWVAQRSHIPVIVSFHNTHFSAQTSLTRLPGVKHLRSLYAKHSIAYALRHADCVTGCSEAVLEHLRTQYPCPRLSQVLYYGIPLPKAPRSQERVIFRQAFNWSADTPIVLHVGRLIEQKNHLGLLSIFELVLAQHPTAKLLLVGEGPLRPFIEQTIAARKLEQAVFLLGIRDDVAFLMRQSDVFLFPSLHEGFGLVAIEANAAQLPVVATRIPGLTEAVREGETALLHPVQDWQGMANSVSKLLSDRQFAAQMGEAGANWVKNHYSLGASTNRLLGIYQDFHSVSSSESIHALETGISLPTP